MLQNWINCLVFAKGISDKIMEIPKEDTMKYSISPAEYNVPLPNKSTFYFQIDVVIVIVQIIMVSSFAFFSNAHKMVHP